MIELPSALAKSGVYSPNRALPDFPRQQRSLPLAGHHFPEGTKELGSETHLVNITLNQAYHRRVSTDRLNREASQLTASLGGEPGTTPTRRKDPSTLMPQNQVSEREGTRYKRR